MAIEMSSELKAALQSDCAHSFEPVLMRKNPRDFAALQGIIGQGASVEPGVCSAALFLLGRWDDPSSVDPILAILPELQEAERISAIDALGRLGTSKALEGVLGYADDPSSDVRKFVAHALGRIKTQPALDKLQEMREHDPAERVRKSAGRYSTG